MPAPIGNTFNRKWKTPKALKKDIDEYFKMCVDKEKPLTISGLALALDTNRQTLLNYENNMGKDFDALIKKAKLMCENFAEEFLFTGKNVAGTIFNLKNNYGYKDRQDIDLTSNNKELTALTSEAHKIMKEAIGGDDQ